MRLAIVAALSLLPLLCAGLLADTVVLKTGEAIDGKVVKRNDQSIELQVQYGTLVIAQDKILRIEEETPEMAAAREKKEAEEREFADKMRAEGKVLYRGKWISEKEKQAELDKIAAAKKKKSDALAAKRKAEELADQKRKEKEEAAQRLAQQRAPQQGLDGRDGRRFARRNRREELDGRDGHDRRTNSGSRIDNYGNYQDVLRRTGIDGSQIDNLIQNVRQRR